MSDNNSPVDKMWIDTRWVSTRVCLNHGESPKAATHLRLEGPEFFVWYTVTDTGFEGVEDDEEEKRLEAIFCKEMGIAMQETPQ